MLLPGSVGRLAPKWIPSRTQAETYHGGTQWSRRHTLAHPRTGMRTGFIQSTPRQLPEATPFLEAIFLSRADS
jgi:hypothetical protein